MNYDTKIKYAISVPVITGIFVGELGLCHKCIEIPLHVPEVFVQGFTDSSSEYFGPTGPSYLSASVMGATGPTGPSQLV